MNMQNLEKKNENKNQARNKIFVLLKFNLILISSSIKKFFNSVYKHLILS